MSTKKLKNFYKNGRGGIRTHGNSRHIGFQDQHHRPLGHPSIAKNQNRTGDTRIFNPLLYRLSYLGIYDDL